MMLRKIFTSESKTVMGAAIVIGFATLASRIIGILRDRVFAHYFGVGPIMDAYYASFKIPDLVYNLLIAGALSSAFIPTFTKLFYHSDGKAPAWRLANNVVTIIAVTLFGVAGLGMVFAPFITRLLFPGFPAATATLATTFTRVMFISPFLLGISMVFGGILQSLKQFFMYSLAPVFYNLGIIIGALALVPLLGPVGIAWGVVLGAFLHLFIQTIGAYSNGFRWRFTFDWTDPETRLVGKLMLPRTVGLAVTQINNIIVTMLASLLAAGSVAVYNFADNLQGAPTGLIAIPFALAVFPVLSALSEPEHTGEFIRRVSETARQVVFLIVPVMVILMLLRAQIVRVILGSGAFGWNATIATANTLAFFAFGLIGQALIPLFARAFFARSNTKTPFIIGIVSEVITIVASLILMRPLGVAGLALGSALGDLANAGLLIWYLRKEVGHLEGHANVLFTYKIATAAIVMGIVIQALKIPLDIVFDLNHFWGILAQGFIAGIVGLLTYGALCLLMRVSEMSDFVQSFRKRWLKFWNIKEGIDEAEQL